MPFLENAQKQIDEFFSDIAPVNAGYSGLSVSYLAVRQGDKFVVVQGRLNLNTTPTKIPLSHFESSNIRAGHFLLADVGLTPREFLIELGLGVFKSPNGDLGFPSAGNGNHSVYYQPFHGDALQRQSHVSVLGVVGAELWNLVRQPYSDWELKAADTPYDNVAELAAEYQVGILRSDAINFEVVAYNIAVIDFEHSKISGTKAQIGVRLAKTASVNEVGIGYRIFNQGKVVLRSKISGPAILWADEPEWRLGKAEFDVPDAAVLQCFVSYHGVALHETWVSDLSVVQNPRRAVYENFDRQLALVREVLDRQGRVRSRDLELAVGWLLWMLGFSSVNLGVVERTQDGPDLLVTTPGGHFAVVECTIGLLKADNKLAHLHDRAQAVRRSLDASSNRHLRVLPVIVTSKTRDEIKIDLEQAERWGILVLTKENLTSMLENTLVLPQADRIFQDAETVVRDARAKYGSQ